ncbi:MULTISPECIES: MAPEG family protein [unclassified Pseudomonas]|uniref:MAPEG family protein n=1 Tax=unclassified Pseudomonas TaxID=196821 RepID=UPI001EDFF1B8|nr:MAPEG family protein [Pseudomonas sp.]MCG4455407.1 hypothetical protein [Pseudomonas sp. MMS21 TM103]
MIIAHLTGGAEQGLLDRLAIAFVSSCVLYWRCYLAAWAVVRSRVWCVDRGLIISLFVVSA